MQLKPTPINPRTPRITSSATADANISRTIMSLFLAGTDVQRTPALVRSFVARRADRATQAVFSAKVRISTHLNWRPDLDRKGLATRRKSPALRRGFISNRQSVFSRDGRDPSCRT